MSGLSGRGAFRVPIDHPCLEGHFPGEPVVPGVLVLEHVAGLVGLPAGEPLLLAWVKFAQPLLPDEVAEVDWAMIPGGIRFNVNRAGTLLARGQFLRENIDG